MVTIRRKQLQRESTSHDTKENISLILCNTLIESTRFYSLQLQVIVVIYSNLTTSRVVVTDVASQLEQSSYKSHVVDEHTKHIVHTEHHEEQITHSALTHILHIKRQRQHYVSITLSKHLWERQHDNEQHKERQHIEHENNKHIEAERIQVIADKVFQTSSHFTIIGYFFFEKTIGRPQIPANADTRYIAFQISYMRT